MKGFSIPGLIMVLALPLVSHGAPAEPDNGILIGNLERRQAWLMRRIERLEEDQTRQQAQLDRLKAQIALYPDDGTIQSQLAAMQEALKAHIQTDLPFHIKERRARLATLEQELADPKTQTALKWQRLQQTFIDELVPGETVEAWDGDLKDISGTGESRLVTFIRYGRLGLAWQSFDGKDGGWWDAKAGQWQPLSPAMAKSVRQGILIALKRVPPDLMVLPWAGMEARP